MARLPFQLFTGICNPRNLLELHTDIMMLFSIPKVTSGTSITPYIKSTPQGAQVDSTRLVNNRERKLANGIRKVEDPVTIKNKAAQVSHLDLYLLRISSMRKFHPKFH
jgi:hypothetical protein